MNDLDIGFDLDLNLELLLNILIDTTREYMEAFQITPKSIQMVLSMLEKHKAFKEITAYYMDDKNECVSFVSFTIDWKKYELQCKDDDPDIILNRKSISNQTPKQILESACKIINERVNEIKKERGVTNIKMVFTYSDKIAKDKDLMEQINKEANLVPHTGEIRKSNKINSVQTKIVSSITEKTLSIYYVT